LTLASAKASRESRVARFRPWVPHVIVAAAGILASVSALLYALGASPHEARLNDFYTEAWPAYSALLHGHPLGFLRLGPPYLGSLILRAPFAVIPSAWGGAKAVYFASALPCLLVAVAFCVWLAAQPRRRGGIGWASRLIPITCCIVNPVVLVGLFGGHPEDVLGAVLCVAAVLFAIQGRVALATLLTGAAVFNKPWALVVVPVVMAAMPADRRRATLGVAGVGAAAALAVVVLQDHGLRTGDTGVITGAIFNPAQLLWWVGPHAWLVREAHVGLVLIAVPCAALWWLGRRREPTHAEPDALLLLALVLLLRAALDPWNNLYYHVPFLFALTAWEIRSGRMPLVAFLYSIALLIVTPPHGFPPMSGDLRAGLYAAIVVPTLAWLGAKLYLPSDLAWKRYNSERLTPSLKGEIPRLTSS
jgi:hypothetical protein